jgi:uncharacterized membrane protein HdeD (DUF308 family)
MAAHDAVGEIKSRSGWAIFMGVVTAALGVFLMLYPHITATLTTLVLGWTFVLVGIAQFVFALNSEGLGQFFWKMLAGLVYAGAGIMLATMPIGGVAALTGIVGTLFVVEGVLQSIVAFRVRPVEGWGWILFDGLCSLVLGMLILVQWPSSSVWAIGTLVGVSVLVSGISRIIVGTAIRGGVAHVEKLAHRGA